MMIFEHQTGFVNHENSGFHQCGCFALVGYANGFTNKHWIIGLGLWRCREKSSYSMIWFKKSHLTMDIYSSGWWLSLPLWGIYEFVSWDDYIPLFPMYWKKNVPNHQPNNVNLGLIKPWFINRGPKWKIVIHHDFEGHSNCTIDHGLLIRGWHLTYGDGSKPWYLVNPKIAGKWMFIPLKMVLIGIDPYPYQRFHHKSQFA